MNDIGPLHLLTEKLKEFEEEASKQVFHTEYLDYLRHKINLYKYALETLTEFSGPLREERKDIQRAKRSVEGLTYSIEALVEKHPELRGYNKDIGLILYNLACDIAGVEWWE